MSVIAFVMAAAFLVTLFHVVMTSINLPLLKMGPVRADSDDTRPIRLSVCIPARDEEDNIEGVLRSILDQRLPDRVTLEVLVYNDESTDATPDILARLASEDDRVRSVETRPMPGGWSGKMWACSRLAEAASGDWLLFVDADVRLVTPGGLALALHHATAAPSLGGVSCFPRQVTGSLSEHLVVPLIHFLLLSYLPFPQMKNSASPSASAGCGQFMLVARRAYLEAGGHAAIRDSMHDGIKLTRNLRRAGYATDLFDGLPTASCRMYRGLRQVWSGFAKNAYEGLGSPSLLVFLTATHAIAHVLPWVYLPVAVFGRLALGVPLDVIATPLAGAAILTAIVQRSILAAAFDQPWQGVVLHPVAVSLMTAIQWASFAKQVSGNRSWRGRVLGHAPGD